jgi:hypothetical protein
MTKTNQLILFRKIITGYCEDYTTHRNTLCGQNAEFLNVKKDGVYIKYRALKVKLLHGIPSVLWLIQKQQIYPLCPYSGSCQVHPKFKSPLLPLSLSNWYYYG